MNIQEFIKAKESEFDEKFTVKSNAGNGLLRYTDADGIKHFLYQSILEYNEKIKRDLLQDLDHEECAKCYIERKLTNLTQDTNPKE